jgi:hypothetical protein
MTAQPAGYAAGGAGGSVRRRRGFSRNGRTAYLFRCHVRPERSVYPPVLATGYERPFCTDGRPSEGKARWTVGWCRKSFLLQHANIMKTRMKPTWTCRFWLSAPQCLLGGIGMALLTFVLLSLRANLAIAALLLPNHCCVAVPYGPALFPWSLSPSLLQAILLRGANLDPMGRQIGGCSSCNRLGDLCLDAERAALGRTVQDQNLLL